MSYNLLKEPWIPVIRSNRGGDCVGVIDALDQARQIREIALANPLDLFAVHRFMLTILYWKAAIAGGVEQVRGSLLNQSEVPAAVLRSIRGEERHFDLFDREVPFLQDPTVDATGKQSPQGLFSQI